MRRIMYRQALAAICTLLLFCAYSAPAMAGSDGKPDPVFRYSIAEDGVTIEKYLGTGQTNVTVPQTIDDRPVVRIADFAFAMTEVHEESGYMYTVARTDIESVSLPDGLACIGRRAFEGLESLRSIHIPDTVTEIGYGAFGDCTHLEQARLSAALQEVPASAFQSCALRSVVVPDGIARIGACAFAQNRDLTEVQLPQTLEEIADGAFGDCRALEQLTIPDSLERIGTGAFGGSGLKECTIPNSVTEISPGLFMWCDNLTTVRFSSVPDRIDQNAFLDCPQLETVEVDATSDEWQRVTIDTEGNDGLAAARMVCLKDALDPAGDGQPVTEPDRLTPSTFLESILLQRGSTVRLLNTAGGWQLRGQTAGTSQAALTDTELLNAFALPEGVAVMLVPNGRPIRQTAGGCTATGDVLQFVSDGEVLAEATVIVDGDVLGTGVMSLSQLVRMAQALSGTQPLEDAYLCAADFTESGTVTLSDLVREAALLRALLKE